MDQYCVVEFDDGILSCVKADKLRSNNGQHSARWKNAWYHVAIILIGEQDQCESFVKNKHKEQVTECTNNNELCNEDEPNASSNALSEPYGSDYSDVDPNFVPKESSDEDSSLSNDSLSEDSYVYEQAKSSNAGISESLGNDLNNNSKCYPEQFNKMAATSTDVLSNNVLLNKKIYTADIPVSIVLEKMQSYVPPNNEMPLDPIIPNSKQGSKKYFCKYCKNMFTKLPSHFEKKHKEEEEVRKFLILPKGTEGRKRIIDGLRKQGCFEFNTDKNLNTGHLIVSRRTKYVKQSSDYKICPYCKGMFSKNTIRKHYAKCIPSHEKGNKKMSILSKRVHAKVHKTASSILRDHIFPVMREDDVTNIIRYDELVVAFGNSLCCKYRLEHLYKMIRAKLRLIGRFLLAIKGLDETIDNFSSVFDPEKVDTSIQAIHKVASLNHDTMRYDSPAAAADLGTILKKCGKLLITIFIKNKNFMKKQYVEDFLKVLEEELSISVNRTVIESQLHQKRKKVLELPSTEEINVLFRYADDLMKESFSKLQESFSLCNWKNLAASTLILVQIFNRRRAGEVERILIDDFKAYQTFNSEKDSELLNFTVKKFNQDPKEYSRFVIRGKRAREVTVLLSKDMLESILLILRYRTEANVPDTNPYVFGITGNILENSHLNACKIMRDYSEKCKVSNPTLLRGTQLRKHLATQSALLDLDDVEVGDLANFMGHAEKIHRDHYRLPVAVREVGRISQLLEMGIGKGKGNLSSDTTQEINSVKVLSVNNPARESPTINYPARDSWDNPLETSYGRQRCVSPMGQVRKRSWGANEVQIVTTLFSKHLQNRTLPTTPECFAAIESNDSLSGRTAAQLKSWMSNQFRKKSNEKCRKIMRAYWTEEEKEIMFKIFERNLKGGILPGLKMCTEVQNKYPQLRHRTAVTLRAWVNNTIKKNSKTKNV
ncbi:uncharacterized protein [Leptinotarsa decemlineata]|uniref:uncharacterized protein n=1 Tax=Leptinotarsa decemlineata TaxID=7539 RepID=UPI003D305F81